jgi:hypothetical protein
VPCAVEVPVSRGQSLLHRQGRVFEGL